MEAINYAQKYLSPWQPTQFKRIRQAMALLVFSSGTQCQPYKVIDKIDNQSFFFLL